MKEKESRGGQLKNKDIVVRIEKLINLLNG